MVSASVNARDDVSGFERVPCGSDVAAAPAHRLFGERLAPCVGVSVAKAPHSVFGATGAAPGEGAKADDACPHARQRAPSPT